MSWYFGYVCENCGHGERHSSATEPRPTEEPTPLATAEAAREELEKFAAWMVDWFDPNEPPGAVIEAYLHDVASGWKPEA